MPPDDISVVLAELRDGHNAILARLDTLNGSVASINAELGSVPDARYRDPARPTMRDRLHKIENTQEAVRLLEEARRRTWTARQKWATIFLTGLGAGAAVLRLFGIGG